MFFRQVTHQKDEIKINKNFNIKTDDIRAVLNEYNNHKGLGRYLIAQSDIKKLKALRKQLGANADLNAEQAFELVSIIINREGTQNTASDKALQILETYIYDLIPLALTLKQNNLFCKSIFTLIYNNYDACKAIFENLKLLEQHNITLTKTYVEAICQYTIDKELCLPFILERSAILGLPDFFMQQILQKVLRKEINGSSFLQELYAQNEATIDVLQFYENFQSIYSNTVPMNENRHTF